MTFARVSVAEYTAETDHFFCLCFRQVSVKGNKCFRNYYSEFTFVETLENVAEICLFHVSVDVFRTRGGGGGYSRKFWIGVCREGS